MVNYSQSIIYKICCNNPEIKEIYIGSTCNFARRKCKHKSDCNNENGKSHNLNVYKFIRLNGGWNNFSMIQIEAYATTDKRALHARERYHIETLKPSLNKNIPNQTAIELKIYKKSYQQTNEKNKSYKKGYYKEYYQTNKELYKNRRFNRNLHDFIYS
jgi:2-methylcitrate dehydratase PrpD